MIKLKFIQKVTSMGKHRTVIIIPSDQDKLGAKELRGKYARVYVEEVPVEENHKK